MRFVHPDIEAEVFTHDRLVAEGIACRAPGPRTKAIVRTAAAGRSRLGECVSTAREGVRLLILHTERERQVERDDRFLHGTIERAGLNPQTTQGSKAGRRSGAAIGPGTSGRVQAFTASTHTPKPASTALIAMANESRYGTHPAVPSMRIAVASAVEAFIRARKLGG